MDSILMTIKKLLGIDGDYEHFDQDIIIHINSVFTDLTLMDVGPSKGFTIEDDTSVWTDFVSDTLLLEAVKSYMYLRVKLLFDIGSLSSAAIEAINRDVDRWEFRLNVISENLKREEEIQNG